MKAVFDAKFIYFIGVSRHSAATVIRADWLKRVFVIKNQGQDWLTSCQRFSVCVCQRPRLCVISLASVSGLLAADWLKESRV